MMLISLLDVSLRFVGPPLLEKATLRIHRGERVGLVGRNGSGKTSLMRLAGGELEPDDGQLQHAADLRTARLPQEVPRDLRGTVAEEVARGAISTHAAHDGEHALHAAGDWRAEQQVVRVLSELKLPGDAAVETLSAGMKRRVLLAKALAGDPDLLMLDEPTNHLDVESITFLEDYLIRCRPTLLFVTHDRVFLQKLATRIVDLDRGELTSWSCDYPTYLKRKEALAEAEVKQQALFDKKLAQEEAWIRQGIKARRTRNEGRVRALVQLRQAKRDRRDQPAAVRMQMQEAERSGRLVVKARNIDFAYDSEPVIRGLSTDIFRGDRIGIIGPNGSGKTTLLGVLLGENKPQQGTLRHGEQLEIAYFDQLHAQLDDERSVEENVGGGSQNVTVNGSTKHIIGYLQDFLFSPEQARGLVKFLSGGERNRLLLARLFTKPSNVLVLDEPTNDLDIETLELLEEQLMEYSGTVLLVSHDRAFLNNVVTSTLVMEGEGRVKEYAGGYDDWLTQRQS
ncbi:MAG: ATP-binding cassette domain-containing protein, partial [Planctomycetes bacterium]|nr:ATP-binding cassette domain-containing protein [Planctomycetota bacterium]